MRRGGVTQQSDRVFRSSRQSAVLVTWYAWTAGLHENACMASHSIVTKYVLIFFFYALLLLMIWVGAETRTRNEESELKKQPILSTLVASHMSYAVQNTSRPKQLRAASSPDNGADHDVKVTNLTLAQRTKSRHTENLVQHAGIFFCDLAYSRCHVVIDLLRILSYGMWYRVVW